MLQIPLCRKGQPLTMLAAHSDSTIVIVTTAASFVKYFILRFRITNIYAAYAKQIRYFIAVAERQSVTAAAQASNVSQPAISNLEWEFKAPFSLHHHAQGAAPHSSSITEVAFALTRATVHRAHD